MSRPFSIVALLLLGFNAAAASDATFLEAIATVETGPGRARTAAPFPCRLLPAIAMQKVPSPSRATSRSTARRPPSGNMSATSTPPISGTLR